jgi:hypothetical protein
MNNSPPARHLCKLTALAVTSPPARHLCKLTALAVTVSSRQASQQQVDGAPGPASVTGLI